MFLVFLGHATEVITDCDMEQEIRRGIHSGLGNTLQSNSMDGQLGQNNTREKIMKRY